jgi:hypothetical protein
MLLKGYTRLLQLLLRRRVLSPEPGSSEELVARARACGEDLNLDFRRELQTRPHAGKVVFRCYRSDLGECVFKYISEGGRAGSVQEYAGAMRVVRDYQGALFPRVHSIGPCYSLEEFVEGPSLHKISSEDWQRVDLPDFFRDLRDFGVSLPAGSTLRPRQCKELVTYYAIKALKADHRASGYTRAVTFHRLLRESGRIAGLYRKAVDECCTREVPITYMVDDLWPGNIKVNAGRRLVVIDPEYVREGFWGMDCVWLLTMLSFYGTPYRVIQSGYTVLCDDEFLGFRGGAFLMQRLLLFFLEIQKVVLTCSGSASTTNLFLDQVYQDLRSSRHATRPGPVAGLDGPGDPEPVRAVSHNPK